MSELNIENFKIARQWLIDWPDENFDMSEWLRCDGVTGDELIKRNVAAHACGSAACFGGIIECLQDEFAGEFLGLSTTQDHELFYAVSSFYGKGSGKDLSDITKSQVISRLDQIIKAGKWPDSLE